MTVYCATQPAIRHTTTAAKLRVGLVGFGYWGPNLARNIAAHPMTELSAIADRSPGRLGAAALAYPSACLTLEATNVVDDPELDVIVIATPPETHRDLALAALRAGKHVLVEKPLATSTRDAVELVLAARDAQRQLLIDHTFLFTGAVRRMKSCIDSGDLGRINYFDSTRINLGLFQSQVNVLWDLAPHDIAIMLYLLGSPVRAVSAFGASHVNSCSENIAYVTATFDDNVLAHFHVNWLAPVKIRKTIIGGTRRMLVYDDMESSEKLKIYDSVLSWSRLKTTFIAPSWNTEPVTSSFLS